MDAPMWNAAEGLGMPGGVLRPPAERVSIGADNSIGKHFIMITDNDREGIWDRDEW